MTASAAGRPSIGVVVTCFEQHEQVREAVSSVLGQTRVPAEVVVVDDGSRDRRTREVLDDLEASATVVRRCNAGVAAARNDGIGRLGTDYAAVLDGDDLWEPTFLERTAARLDADAECVAASSWLQMFGVATHLVRPSGGRAVDFLARNACPGSAVLRRSDWRGVGGYRESMRHGFEDWDLFLGLLERGGRIDVVPEPLLRYRTAATSLNVTSMAARLDRFGDIVRAHEDLYRRHVVDALLAVEATSIRRLQAWELLVMRDPRVVVPEPGFGDGGMAAAVRIASGRAGDAAQHDRDAAASTS